MHEPNRAIPTPDMYAFLEFLNTLFAGNVVTLVRRDGFTEKEDPMVYVDLQEQKLGLPIRLDANLSIQTDELIQFIRLLNLFLNKVQLKYVSALDKDGRKLPYLIDLLTQGIPLPSGTGRTDNEKLIWRTITLAVVAKD